jgi:hypothetical protein
MHKFVTAATVLTIFANASASAQTVPALRQGEQYIAVRNKLIKAGWQRDGGENNDCRIYPNMCKKFTEFASASGDGYCKFIWRNMDGKLLGISTFPCNVNSQVPGPVTGWRWE